MYVRYGRFVATANADGWDPSAWDGNIWDSDDYDTGPDEDVGPDEGSEIDPPSLQVKPIQRRRLVQGALGNNRQDVMEDYTHHEISDIRERMKQKSGEPLDRWLVRLYDQGASQVRVDAVDSMHFLDLCNDPVVWAGMKTEAETLDANESGLLTLIANAVYRRFPDEGSWPSKEGQWHTLTEAVSRLRELAMRVAVATGHTGDLDDTPLTLSMRNAIIKNAPSQYKGPVMAVLLGAEDWTIGGTVTRLRELGDLGEWDKIEKPRFTPNNGKSSGNTWGGNQEGVSRRQLWALLRQAGVNREDMDGKPTSELIKMARKKGVVKGDPPQPVKQISMVQCCERMSFNEPTCKCNHSVYKSKNKKKDMSSSSSSESSSSEDESEEEPEEKAKVCENKSGTKGKKKAKKGKNKKKSLYPRKELDEMAKQHHY